LSMLLASGKCLPKLRHLPGLSFFLSASFPLACEVQEARFHFLPTRSVCCACRVIPGWSSPSGARTGCFVRCDSSHDMSRCFGLSVQAGALIALQCTWCLFVPTLAHLRFRVGVVGVGSRGGGGRDVLPAGAQCAVRAGFIVSCSVLSTAGRRGGRSRRPFGALSMGRVRQVTTFCETATWAHRSSVAHLVSLHNSYSHRTPREGVRSPSGPMLSSSLALISVRRPGDCRLSRPQMFARNAPHCIRWKRY
jgi:hypothetical protein